MYYIDLGFYRVQCCINRLTHYIDLCNDRVERLSLSQYTVLIHVFAGFGNTATVQPQQQNTSGFSFGVNPQQSTGFQLQNPPVGNKRGKKA